MRSRNSKNDPPYSNVLHYNTITTYFDIVGLQVLHSTQYTTLYTFCTTIHCIHSSDHSTSDILYIVFLTLYPVRYRYNTVPLHLLYIIQSGFIFCSLKNTSLYFTTSYTVPSTLTDRGLTFGITHICIKLYTLYTTHMVPYTPNYSPRVFLTVKMVKVKRSYGVWQLLLISNFSYVYSFLTVTFLSIARKVPSYLGQCTSLYCTV